MPQRIGPCLPPHLESLISDKRRPPAAIHIPEALSHNVKGFDHDLPPAELVVITGVSGSGKSSLAFDTPYSEGQRRYG